MNNYSRPLDRTTPSCNRQFQKTTNGITEFFDKVRAIIPANKAPGVDIFADEQLMFHVLLRRRQHNPIKKDYEDIDIVQSFSPADWKQMTNDESQTMKQYDNVVILHDPSGIKTVNKKDLYLDSYEDEAATQTEPVVEKPVVETKKAAVPKAPTTPKKETPVKEPVVEKKEETQAPPPEKVQYDINTARAEFLKLYGTEAEDGTTLEELVELITAKQSNV